MKKELISEYKQITEKIINNDKFQKTKEDLHHGSNKYEHLIRVSKCSFILGKIFKANIESVTKAALLHDFFFGSRKTKKENSYLNHPKTAAKNAKTYFNINKLEEDAIKSHMYHHVIIKKVLPFINRNEKAKVKDYKPNSKEGWIVCISDLIISIVETIRFELTYIVKLSFLIIISAISLRHFN